MTFAQLYGEELDRELGSADRTVLFTAARRKAGINAGQLEWNSRTECLQRRVTVAMVDGTQEYDLEVSATDFLRIAKEGIKIKIVSGSTTRYIEGDDLEFTSIERLNVEEPGWMAASASTPLKYYLRPDGGALYLGLHPAPDVSGSDTWSILVPVVIIPADMSMDPDEPFTYSANILKHLRPYHRALAYWGAHDCEQYRKDPTREGVALQKFELEVEKYLATSKPKGGQRVRFAKDYRGLVRRGPRRPLDPRIYP